MSMRPRRSPIADPAALERLREIAKKAPVKVSQSDLAPHEREIFKMLKNGHTYSFVLDALEQAIQWRPAISTLYEFVQRAKARRAKARRTNLDSLRSSQSAPVAQTTTEQLSEKTHTDIPKITTHTAAASLTPEACITTRRLPEKNQTGNSKEAIRAAIQAAKERSKAASEPDKKKSNFDPLAPLLDGPSNPSKNKNEYDHQEKNH